MTNERPALERWITRTFGDPETKRFGSGWMSGTSGVFLGFLAVLGVLAFRFPDLLSSPELRGRYSIPVLRALLETAIALAFVLGFISMLLKLTESFDPDTLIVAFDKGRAAFRSEVLERYKIHRPPTPDELRPQFPRRARSLDAAAQPPCGCPRGHRATHRHAAPAPGSVAQRGRP